MCHRVGGVWLFFVFWVERLLVRSLTLMVVCACACDDQAFVVLSFFCVGWLLVRCWVSGMTHVLLFLCDRLLHAVGRLLCGGLFCGVWVLCENWIVDASILFFCKFDFSCSFSVCDCS